MKAKSRAFFTKTISKVSFLRVRTRQSEWMIPSAHPDFVKRLYRLEFEYGFFRFIIHFDIFEKGRKIQIRESEIM